MKSDLRRFQSIPKKIWNQGLKWLFKRTRTELRSPTLSITRTIVHAIQSLNACTIGLKNNRIGETDYIFAFYDLTVEPITYDFAYFLAEADRHARSRGKTRIFVYIVQQDAEFFIIDEKYEIAVDESRRKWRIANILIPLLLHYPPVVGFSMIPRSTLDQLKLPDSSSYPPMYSKNYNPPFLYLEAFSNLASSGFTGFEATTQGRRYVETWLSARGIANQNIVAITLRRYNYDAIRNSNIEAWSQFANWLRPLGYHPVFIPDTDSCWESLPELHGEIIFSEAAWNLGLRMAMNELAYLNFFVSNGTAAIAQLSSRCRYVAFIPVIDSSEQAQESVYRGYGLDPEVSERFPFSLEHQIICFDHDDFENIKTSFLRFVNDISMNEDMEGRMPDVSWGVSC
jgi:hypothetical protein